MMQTTLLTLLHSSVSGMLARQIDLDTIANNLANVNTSGYKPARVDFKELLEPNMKDTELAGPYRGTGLGVTRISVSPGALTMGDSPLAMAIEGDGFFAVNLSQGGVAYTRDGRFTKDANNNLVTASGRRVVWQGTLPADAQNLHVNPDGSVMAQVNNIWTQVGRLQTYRFVNPSGLLNVGDSSFQVSNDSGAAQAGTPGATGYGRIMSGVIESSATNLSDEISNMIVAQRAYSMSVKAFQQTDDMIGLAIRLRVR